MYPRVPSANSASVRSALSPPGESEIENFDVSIGAEHQVVRFDIPMNNAAGVRRGKGVGDLPSPESQLLDRLGCAAIMP